MGCLSRKQWLIHKGYSDLSTSSHSTFRIWGSTGTEAVLFPDCPQPVTENDGGCSGLASSANMDLLYGILWCQSSLLGWPRLLRSHTYVWGSSGINQISIMTWRLSLPTLWPLLLIFYGEYSDNSHALQLHIVFPEDPNWLANLNCVSEQNKHLGIHMVSGGKKKTPETPRNN